MTTANPHDLLALLAEDGTLPAQRDDIAVFLAACEADAAAHGGFVSVQRVRDRLADAQIPARRYSSLWSRFTGAGRPMLRAGGWETCTDTKARNAGRPQPLRVWVGVA